MKASITVLGGDGIGPEVAAQGVRCLDAIARRFGHQFTLDHQPFGGAAIDLTGEPLPQATLQLANGLSVGFPIDPFARYCLLNGVDELGFLLQQQDHIAAYEQRHKDN